jgi:cyclohexadieny/prephenate dehydrogenase
MTSAPHFKRVALIGVGLIGSSLARVLRREGMADEIVGCARSQETRERIVELDLVDRAEADPGAAAEGADLVVLCTHLGAYGEIGKAIAPRLSPGAIVSDVGSVKQAVIETLAPLLPDGVHLVPGHPVAGTEFSGPDAGFAELFDGRWCILTPPAGTDETAVERLASMWRSAGMTVEIMDARHHDMVLALTSHLPHAIAYTIVGTATELEGDLKSEVVKFSAGGFRDYTRIAASNPEFWRDVFLANRGAVLEVLDRFTEDLSALRKAIRRSDGTALEALFTRTRDIRRGIIEAHQEQAEEEKRSES